MKKQKLFCFMLMVGAASINTPSIYGQAGDSLGRPSWMSTPKPQLAPSADTATSADVRRARSDMFNSPASLGAPDLTSPDSAGRGTGRFDDYSMPESLPVNSSDVIVTGTVTNTQPFLSADHTWVYSELTFMPDEIIKDLSKTLISGEPAVLLGAGGSLKLPNGRIASLVAGGGSSPINVDRHYLLFLHYAAGAKAYTVNKAWDLSGEEPQELDLNGHPSRRITPDSNYTTTRESLLALVKSRVQAK